jgi:flagellar basal-body rod protein FlgB
MIEAIHGLGVSMAKHALDAASLRHQAIAHNLANLHSEGYAPLGVRFDARLAAARRAGSSGRPELVQESPQNLLPPSLDNEMVKLAQNTLHYQALVRALGKHHAILGAAIADGRRA